jgi:hypothetical protein
MKGILKWIAIAGFVSIAPIVTAQDANDFGSGKDSILCVQNMSVYQHRYRNEEHAPASILQKHLMRGENYFLLVTRASKKYVLASWGKTCYIISSQRKRCGE